MAQTGSRPGRVVLARIVRPRGNRGEVAAEDFSAGPEQLLEARRLFLRRDAGEAGEAGLEAAWSHKGRLVLKFCGIDSIEAAERLRGCWVEALAAELGPPPEGEFYYRDLVGCAVEDARRGREIGRVVRVDEAGANVLLAVEGPEGEVMIPFAREICVGIALDEKVIRVRLPGGLEELNRR